MQIIFNTEEIQQALIEYALTSKNMVIDKIDFFDANDYDQEFTLEAKAELLKQVRQN